MIQAGSNRKQRSGVQMGVKHEYLFKVKHAYLCLRITDTLGGLLESTTLSRKSHAGMHIHTGNHSARNFNEFLLLKAIISERSWKTVAS